MQAFLSFLIAVASGLPTTASDRQSRQDEKQSSNDEGSEGWKIGKGNAVGRGKN
jgi:hypothetical protein